MRMKAVVLVAAFVAMLFAVSRGDAQDPFAGCAAIPVAVPAFSCADGLPVPKEVVRSKCRHPEDLYNRCVVDSRLGVLSRGDVNGVDIVFSCRKNLADMTTDGFTGQSDPNTLKFYDIAAIQYERKTGKTCFYQWLGSSRDNSANMPLNSVMPAPSSPEGKAFWGKFGGYGICSGCHTNNAFIRTPHYDFALTERYSVDPSAEIEHNGMRFKGSEFFAAADRGHAALPPGEHQHRHRMGGEGRQCLHDLPQHRCLS